MQNLPTPKSFPITIDFLVYDRFSNHCMANTLEPFRAANTLSANDVYEWNFVTLDGLSVQSSSELRLMPDQKFGETKRADFLFKIGRDTSELQSQQDISNAVFCLKKTIEHHIRSSTSSTHIWWDP